MDESTFDADDARCYQDFIKGEKAKGLVTTNALTIRINKMRYATGENKSIVRLLNGDLIVSGNKFTDDAAMIDWLRDELLRIL